MSGATKLGKRPARPRRERSLAEIKDGLPPALGSRLVRAYIDVARVTPGSVVTMDPDAEEVVV